MIKEDIIRMAQQVGLVGINPHQNGIYVDVIEAYTKLVVDHIYAEQLELPEPRLTGKFSISAGKFKCTGCTGTWTNREDAKHHSCKDYQ